MKNIIAMKSAALSTAYDIRYVIVDKDTGEILDDAQGYGYKTAQKAYAAYGYKNRTPSQKNREKEIKKWMKEHKRFVRDMDKYAFEIAKGSWGPDDKFDSKLVKEMLDEYGLKPDFSAGELLRVWRKS